MSTPLSRFEPTMLQGNERAVTQAGADQMLLEPADVPT
jgi:hypothetical protein